MSELTLPEGYEIKLRRLAFGTYYYWSYAGGEQWGKDYATRNGATNDAIKHAESSEKRTGDSL